MEVVEALREALSAEVVMTEPVSMEAYRFDKMDGVGAGSPLAVVQARDVDDVALTLRICHGFGVPVVPRGAGSGLTGGSNAVDGAVTLSVARMDRIREVSPGDGVAVVEPGVLNTALREHVRPYGLLYAPDPSSRDICSIGGNVATNAGGLCCVKYGVTRDSVLALQVVLADGTVMRVGHRSMKGVAGYDLVGLFVGSEGTLGVVTEVTVKLRPLPDPARTLVAVCTDLAAAGRAIDGILAAGTPSLLELMDRTTVRAVEAWKPMGLDTEAAALLIAQSDLPGAAGDVQAAQFEAACVAAGVAETYRSETVEEAEALLEARRLALVALEQLGKTITDDVAVPRSRLGELVTRIEQIAVEHDVVVATLGHAGDGNLHPTFVLPPGDAAAEERAWDAFHAILDAGVALGGTVTGEHGIGTLKREALARELDPTAAVLHSRIKAALDPTGILNPGKGLPLGQGS